MSKTDTSLRFDKLQPGSLIVIQCDGDEGALEKAFFIGIVPDESGKAEKRRARLMQRDSITGRVYEYEIYRYQGRWAYGTSAGRISVISIDGGL